MKKFITIFALAISIVTNAQDYKRTQNWYFGDSAGLSFATDPSTVLTDGAMYAGEGCATISDTNGNLLFYTNGVTVWNRNHQVMDNGIGLNGHISSTQSSLIVPWPDNDSLYYIFTTDAVGQWKGLCYSLVNMNENNGNGKVIKKNVLLKTPVSEKLAATKHLNGRDYWVLARGYSNNNFYSYLITDNGIIECPVITAIGATSSNTSDAQGEIKFSTDGAKLVEAVYSLSYNRVDIFSFDREKGIPNSPISIPNIILPFSVELSQNAKYLYVTNRLNYIYQFDLTKETGSDIRNTQYEIYFSGNTINSYHVIIQKGIDNKLYISLHDSVYLSVINNPEKDEDSCDFVLKGISLGNKSQFGIPNFVSSYFYRPVLDLRYETNCTHDTIHFEARSEGTIASPIWNIIRNGSSIYSSSQLSFDYALKDTGQYLIRLVSNGDTVEKTLFIESKLELGNDTVLCNQNSFELNIPSNFRCIQWQDSSGTNHYTISENDTYHVHAYNQKGCLVSDTINVKFSFIPKPQITRSGDTLFTDSGSYAYQWFFNNNPIPLNTHLIKVAENGNYKVEITDTNGCSNVSDNFSVTGLSVSNPERQKFTVYPNPSNKESRVFIEGEEIINEAKVLDIAGRIIFQEKDINAYQFSLILSERGLYILTINGNSNYKLMIE